MKEIRLKEPENYKEEIIAFLAMCSPEDIHFLDRPDSERSVKDYARFVYIAIGLDNESVLFRMMGEMEEHGRMQEFFDYGRSLADKHRQAKIWIEDFIEKIPRPAIKALVRQTWQERVRAYKERHRND